MRKGQLPAARASALHMPMLLVGAFLLAYSIGTQWPISQQLDTDHGGAGSGGRRHAVEDDSGELVGRYKYGLPADAVEAAILASSERHGRVAKTGVMPAAFWANAKRPWRENRFMTMARRDMAQPRMPEYWATDSSTGEQYLKPLPLPFPACHVLINHKYKVIYVMHPKSASTATKRYMTDCRHKKTDHCLQQLELEDDPTRIEKLWKEYFVFTFVRNPWVRAHSSWKFLRGVYMKPPEHGGKHGLPACVEAGWKEFCGDPLLLARTCLAIPHCCPFEEGAHFMGYHIVDQGTCLMTPQGDLVVDYIGRVEHVDEDMAEVIKIINSRLPKGVTPLEPPESVPAWNTGPGADDRKEAPDNTKYLPSFQGPNATCFAKLSRFYEKDIRVMFPTLYSAVHGSRQDDHAAAAEAALRAAIAAPDDGEEEEGVAALGDDEDGQEEDEEEEHGSFAAAAAAAARRRAADGDEEEDERRRQRQ